MQGEQPPPKVLEFFNDCYKFVLREVGYHGTDENILSAVIHFDETTPHLQLYYVPIVDQGKKKVYAKGREGKVLRNEKGSPIQAKVFTMNSICRMIRNEKYIGLVTVNDTTYTNVVPPIVDKRIFKECNLIMDGHKHRQREVYHENPYILSGKMFCGYCWCYDNC